MLFLFGGIILVRLIELLAARTDRMRTSEIRDLLRVITEDVISFAGGLPDPSTFPTDEELHEIFEFIKSIKHKAFQYGLTEGLPELKEELVKFLKLQGIEAEPTDIIITSGSQQAIEISARLFINQKDVVIVELPTYLAAIQAFNMYRPSYLGIPMDEYGMKTEVLEDELKRLISLGRKPKLIYVIPTCQNPTGLSMSMDRRRHLLELASTYDLFIIEDDPYGYIIFEDVELKRLKAMDVEGRVIYISTFSKIFAPGIRLGWAVADREVTRYMVLAKQALDICPPNLSQYIAYYALKAGFITKRIPMIRRLYKEKRDAMLKALEEYMPDTIMWTKPIGGMFTFMWLPEFINTKMLLHSVIKKYKVAYVPGRSFFVDGSGWNTIRLSYSYPPVEKIYEGINRLSKAIKEVILRKERALTR